MQNRRKLLTSNWKHVREFSRNADEVFLTVYVFLLFACRIKEWRSRPRKLSADDVSDDDPSSPRFSREKSLRYLFPLEKALQSLNPGLSRGSSFYTSNFRS